MATKRNSKKHRGLSPEERKNEKDIGAVRSEIESLKESMSHNQKWTEKLKKEKRRLLPELHRVEPIYKERLVIFQEIRSLEERIFPPKNKKAH